MGLDTEKEIELKPSGMAAATRGLNAPAKKRSSPRPSSTVVESAVQQARAIGRLTREAGGNIDVDSLLDAAEVVEATGGYLALRIAGDIGSQSVEFVVMKSARRSPTKG